MHLNYPDLPLAASFLDTGALKLLLEGGLFMWPLLALLILAIAVIIERYRSLKLLETDASELREKIVTLLSEDKVEESLELCETSRGPVPAVLSCGLRKYLVLRRLNYDQAQMEQQAPIPQLRIEVDRKRALAYGVTPGELNEELASRMMCFPASREPVKAIMSTSDFTMALPWSSAPCTTINTS